MSSAPPPPAHGPSRQPAPGGPNPSPWQPHWAAGQPPAGGPPGGPPTGPGEPDPKGSRFGLIIGVVVAIACGIAALTTALVLTLGGDSDDEMRAASGDPIDDVVDRPPQLVDEVLVVGTLLPQTGVLSHVGLAQTAGVELAVNEINAAGGALGNDVELHHADSGDGEPDIAADQVDDLLGRDVAVIIGAAASGLSMTVIDQITGEGVLQFSPSSTSSAFDEHGAGGELFFRTAPSDVLHGRALAEVALNDRHREVAVLSRDDEYGNAVSHGFVQAFEQFGGAVAADVRLDPTASSFETEIGQIAGASPDALVLIAYDETVDIVQELQAAGVGPQDIQLYFADGNLGYYGDALPDGMLEGVKGPLPGAEVSSAFEDRLLDVDPALQSFGFAPEAYDAVIVSALAAIAAQSVDGATIGEHVAAVTGGGGSTCTTFAECKELLESGEDIDYDGASGRIEIGVTGSPIVASYGIVTYGADNTFDASQAQHIDVAFGD